MPHIKLEVSIYANQSETARALEMAFQDEELVRQFAVEGALGIRDAVADYLGITRYSLDYDVETDDWLS